MIKTALDRHDQQSLKARRAGNIDESHQVHSFVLGFANQRAYPALIAFQAA
jgi:hypothetical protein